MNTYIRGSFFKNIVYFNIPCSFLKLQNCFHKKTSLYAKKWKWLKMESSKLLRVMTKNGYFYIKVPIFKVFPRKTWENITSHFTFVHNLNILWISTFSSITNFSFSSKPPRNNFCNKLVDLFGIFTPFIKGIQNNTSYNKIGKISFEVFTTGVVYLIILL